jgi:hypothetical protein
MTTDADFMEWEIRDAAYVASVAAAAGKRSPEPGPSLHAPSEPQPSPSLPDYSLTSDYCHSEEDE